jgi:membrane protease YdiL (CAAX protease family)
MKVLGWCLGRGLIFGGGVLAAGAAGALPLAGSNSGRVLLGLTALTLLLLGGVFPDTPRAPAQEDSPGPDDQTSGARYPSFVQALGLEGVLVALLLLWGLLWAFATRAADAWLLGLGLGNVVSFGLVIGLGWRRGGAAAVVFPLRRFPLQLLPGIGALLAGVTVLASEAHNLMQWWLGPEPPFLRASELLLSPAHPWPAVLAVLVLVAPVTEEPLFRGLMLGGFLRRYASGVAITLSALLFAAAHLNPWQLPGIFAVGVALGWLYARTQNLLPCLLGHAFFNAVPVALIYLLPPLPGFSAAPTDAVQFQPLGVDLLALVLVAGGLAWLQRVLPVAPPWRPGPTSGPDGALP